MFSNTEENIKSVRQLKLYMVGEKRKQYEVASDLGIPPQTLNRWLNKKVKISKAYLQLLRLRGIIDW